MKKYNLYEYAHALYKQLKQDGYRYVECLQQARKEIKKLESWQ